MSLYFEQVQEGESIKPLVKNPGYQQIVKWAYAEGNTGPTHYDPEVARTRGLKDATLQGRLLGAFLGQAVEEWADYVGRIRHISWRNQSVAHPNDTLTVTGTVSKAYLDDDQGMVECLLEMRSQRDDIIISGKCVIAMPRRETAKD